MGEKAFLQFWLKSIELNDLMLSPGTTAEHALKFFIMNCLYK